MQRPMLSNCEFGELSCYFLNLSLEPLPNGLYMWVFFILIQMILEPSSLHRKKNIFPINIIAYNTLSKRGKLSDC